MLRASKLTAPQVPNKRRCHFLRNGDRYFNGVWVSLDRLRTIDAVKEELTRVLALAPCKVLSTGVRTIYKQGGEKVTKLEEFQHNVSYFCAGIGEAFQPHLVDSKGEKEPQKIIDQPLEAKQKSATTTGGELTPKLIFIIRNGVPPRKIIRVLINKRVAPNMNSALTYITERIKLDTGAVRKMYHQNGNQVSRVEDFNSEPPVFFAFGYERHTREDLILQPIEFATVVKERETMKKSLGHDKKEGASVATVGFDRHTARLVLHKLVMPNKSAKEAEDRDTCQFNEKLLPLEISADYKFGNVIGSGTFSVVHEITDKKSLQKAALKIIFKKKMTGNEDLISNEVMLLQDLKHPNIVEMLKQYHHEDYLFLTMELVKGGDLFDEIVANRFYAEPEASFILKQIMSAIVYLHQKRIVHRDIKPENLLVTRDEQGNMVIKLGDFGLAQKLGDTPLYSICGTPTYVSPEMLAEAGYGLKVDVWASGIILYILLCGFPPFVSAGNDQEELFAAILGGMFEFPSPYWDDVSDSARELVASMLQFDPDLRFSSEDVVEHPWLADTVAEQQASFLLYSRFGIDLSELQTTPVSSSAESLHFNIPSSFPTPK